MQLSSRGLLTSHLTSGDPNTVTDCILRKSWLSNERSNVTLGTPSATGTHSSGADPRQDPYDDFSSSGIRSLVEDIMGYPYALYHTFLRDSPKMLLATPSLANMSAQALMTPNLDYDLPLYGMDRRSPLLPFTMTFPEYTGILAEFDTWGVSKMNLQTNEGSQWGILFRLRRFATHSTLFVWPDDKRCCPLGNLTLGTMSSGRPTTSHCSSAIGRSFFHSYAS